MPPAPSPGLFCSLRSTASPSHRCWGALPCRPAHVHHHPSALRTLVGWREAPEPTSPDASGYPPLQMGGHLPSPGEGAAVCTDAVGAASPRGVLSRTTQRQHLWGGPRQARESEHIKAPAAQAATTPAASSGGRCRRRCEQQLFPITDSSRIYQKTQGRGGKGRSHGQQRGCRKEPTRSLQLPGPGHTSASPPPSILALVFTSFHASLRPLLWGASLAPIKILVSLESPTLPGLPGHRGERRHGHSSHRRRGLPGAGVPWSGPVGPWHHSHMTAGLSPWTATGAKFNVPREVAATRTPFLWGQRQRMCLVLPACVLPMPPMEGVGGEGVMWGGRARGWLFALGCRCCLQFSA